MGRMAGVVALTMVLALGAWAQEGSGPLVVVESVPSDGLLSVELDAPDAVAAQQAHIERNGALEPVAAQLDPLAGGRARLTVLLPPDTPAGARLRLQAAQADPVAPMGGTVSVRTEDARIVVDTGVFEVVHDPAVNAGLPSRVLFHETGAAFEGFFLNDRVYTASVGAFTLRHGQGAVRAVASGPLEAIIEVAAPYLSGGVAPPSNPRVTYRFRYRAGSPAVEVRADCVQDQPFPWDELHVVEWHFPSRPLPQWAAGPPTLHGANEVDNESRIGARWGCLTDGAHVFGIIGDHVRLYSGTPTYGSYVHGPWRAWKSLETSDRATVWLDARPGAIERLDEVAESPATPGRSRMSTPEIEELRARVTAAVAALAPGPARGMAAWRLSRIVDPARWTSTPLPESRARLDTLAADIAAGRADADPFEDGALHNGAMGALFAEADAGAGLLSLYSLEREREFVAQGGPAALWRMTVEDADGAAQTVDNTSIGFRASARCSGAEATLQWTGLDALEGLTVTVAAKLDGPRLAMRLDVDNRAEALSVIEVVFPDLRLGPIGDSPDDDHVLVPTVSGAVWPAPLVKGVSAVADYPSGWGTMQFGAHYDGDAGLYVAIHDPVAANKVYRVARDADGPCLRVTVGWPAADASRMGNAFAMPGDAVLEFFAGDWFDAAQVYRDWARREARWWPHPEHPARPDIPAWMRAICVWGRPDGYARDAVAPTVRFAEYMGVPTAVHWYNWHVVPFDDDYPHYFPAKEGFAEGVAAMQQAGVRVMPYINGRLWDDDTEDFLTVALPAATKGRDGAYYIERYGSGQDLVPMCPTQDLWRDKVQEIVLRLLGPECNVDGVYIDQVAAAGPRLCHDAAHGHPLGGGHWWTTQGYWPMLEELNAVIDRDLPEKMLTTECNAEPYTHLFDGYLTWHYQYQHAVPAFAAVYGGKVLSFGRAYNGGDTQAHLSRSGQALVWGEQLGWTPVSFIDSHPEAAAHLRRCARVRYHLLDYLAEGRMERPPRVSGAIPDITSDWAWSGHWPVTVSALQSGAWRAPDGSLAVIFANTVNEPLAFTWHFDPQTYGLPSGERATERVTEEGHTPGEPVSGAFDRAMTLEPLAVEALVIR